MAKQQKGYIQELSASRPAATRTTTRYLVLKNKIKRTVSTTNLTAIITRTKLLTILGAFCQTTEIPAAMFNTH